MATVLVTGVSRRRGIGFAIASRLRADGWTVVAHGHRAADAREPWGADPPGDLDGLAPLDADLADPEAPAALLAAARERAGTIDALVLNHARSQDGTLEALTAEALDATWAVNVRATLLLVQAWAAQAPSGGRVVLLTSGQDRGPMPGELPYAVSKGALASVTATLADALADRRITVNAVNPGPTDTGWATPDLEAFVARHMPAGRWNAPEEAAGVVALLLSPDAASVTGQVLHAEGGFRRFA